MAAPTLEIERLSDYMRAVATVARCSYVDVLDMPCRQFWDHLRYYNARTEERRRVADKNPLAALALFGGL